MNAFDKFSLLPSLKPNRAKCEIAVNRVLEWVSLNQKF